MARIQVYKNEEDASDAAGVEIDAEHKAAIVETRTPPRFIPIEGTSSEEEHAQEVWFLVISRYDDIFEIELEE